MTGTLAGGWALIAGATGVIGAAVADTLADRGTNLVLHAGANLDSATAQSAHLATKYAVRTVPLRADVTDPTALDTICEYLATEGVPALNALVNCTTGFNGKPHGIDTLDPAEFRRVVDVDLVGGYLLVRAFLPLLRRAPAARVVLLSSLAGLRGRPGAAHLCAAKAGLVGLALGLSRDLAGDSIAVNVVAPGPVGPPDAGQLPPGVLTSTPEEVAAAVLLLADLTSRLSGQVIVVNGGQP
jgi:NAD(P)-dependent dehydrogenase (short-subunit alcohol dehydrogenase family)